MKDPRRVIRSTQVESVVRAAQRAGLRRIRVVVDYERGRIEIEGDMTPETTSVRSLDTISFRAQ
ncbi:hypothetical protein LY05_00315 [Oceanicella actignis]|nr:hypothetical protein LY05_00315 [Oceanicella actignis]